MGRGVGGVLGVRRVVWNRVPFPDSLPLVLGDARWSATSSLYPLSESKPRTTVRGQAVFSGSAQANVRTIHQIGGHWHPSFEERTVSHPSLTMSGTSTKAATGSAHDLCQMALMLKPARAIQAI